MKTYSNFIAGEWIASKTGRTFQNSNPADTREIVAEYPLSGKEDALHAITAAREVFPQWSGLTAVARGRILSKASQVLESRKGELAEILTRRKARRSPRAPEKCNDPSISSAFGGLVTRSVDKPFRTNCREICFNVRQALGVVGLITPWNFPWPSPPGRSRQRLPEISSDKPASQARR
jgi:aldehyde dehydrogenase (NAD+)